MNINIIIKSKINRKKITNEGNIIKNFPLDKFEKRWPFSEKMAMELLYFNSHQKYYSLTEFIVDNQFENYTQNSLYKYNSNDSLLLKTGTIFYTTPFNGFLIQDDTETIFYKDFDKQIYTLKNVPYPLIVCEAIKFRLESYYNLTQTKGVSFNWSLIVDYLLNTTFPVRKMLEEKNYIKSYKKDILEGFYKGFRHLQQVGGLLNFFSNSKVKNFPESLIELYLPLESLKKRLLKVLVFSEIPKQEAEKLTEDCFLTEDLTAIISYYKNLLSKP